MKLIVGLGNPGRRYRETRHNVGFIAVEKLANRLSAASARSRFDGEVAEGRLSGEKVILLCPGTYMNDSGRSVRKAVDYYGIELEDLLVACDDFNLELGQLRLRAKGSGGGQKGLSDIIRVLGSENISRLRIGIGPPPAGWNIPDYVLSAFNNDEKPEIELATDRAALAAEDFILHGIGHSMNEYNGKY